MTPRKKTTLNEIGETLAFIVERMATKDDLKRIEDRLTAVESKLAGVNRRLDTEAMSRDDLKIAKRVSDLEVETFGASRQPKHLPL